MAALNNPLTGQNDGKIGLPQINAGMNKKDPGVGKTKPNMPDDDDWKALGQDEETHDDEELLTRARKRMERCITHESDNRKAALNDRKFYKGEQWPSDVAAQRNMDKRPCLTINKLPTFVKQITNEQRQNRPSIHVSPVGDKGDVEAAKMFRGLVRAIERDSSADIAYDTAFSDAATSGLGYIRLAVEWESPTSFRQVLRIKRIRNPFTVYMDPDHQEPDGADGKFCFVTEIIPTDEYKERYPDSQVAAFDQGAIGDKYRDWSSKEGVRVAEYYEVVQEMETLIRLNSGHIGWKEDLAPEAQRMIKSGKLKVLDERESMRQKIKVYKINGVEVLERTDWLGEWIPIIKVVGEELDIEGKVTYSGIVRRALDPQRMFNYWATMETEMIALAPKAPWIVEEGQIEGYENMWRNANQKSYPYLQYRATSVDGHPTPPPQRQPFAQVPAGIVNAKQGAAQDMQAVTGIRFDGTMQERMNDESGRAVRELRRQGDIGAFDFIDNLGRSLKFLGTQIIELIPKIYDEEQALMILREDGSEEQIKLNPHANEAFREEMGPDGKKLKIFNPNVGKYGVTVTIGPSYATKRIEAAESMMEFAKALPNTATLIADLIAKNQDWEGSEEMATRLAKAVPPNLLTPDQKDVPPQIQAVMQNMEMQIKQLHQQLQQAMAALTDKDKDRAIAQEKISADFEAKLIAVMQKAETESKKLDLEQVRAMADMVKSLHDTLLPQPAGPAGQDREMSNAGSDSPDNGGRGT